CAGSRSVMGLVGWPGRAARLWTGIPRTRRPAADLAVHVDAGRPLAAGRGGDDSAVVDRLAISGRSYSPLELVAVRRASDSKRVVSPVGIGWRLSPAIRLDLAGDACAPTRKSNGGHRARLPRGADDFECQATSRKAGPK